MVMPHRRPSAAMRSIHRELERRRPKPLAPKRPAAKKPSALPPPSREATQVKIQKSRPRPARKIEPSVPSMARSSSTEAHPPPPWRPRPQAPPSASLAVSPVPTSSSLSDRSSVTSILGSAAHLKIADGASARPLFAASASSAPPPRSCSSAIGSNCSATYGIESYLKPGTRIEVRTRTLAKIDGKTLVLWLVATVVSATDGAYEIIYDGNLPRDDPFSTVHVPLHHVRPIKQSPPPPFRPPYAAASSSASATNTLSARPTTAGKSLRILQTLWPEMQLPSRPAAEKSIHLVDKSVSEMKLPATDGNLSEKSSLQNSPPPRAANPTLAAASNTSKMQSAPRPTPAGKIGRLIHSQRIEDEAHAKAVHRREIIARPYWQPSSGDEA